MAQAGWALRASLGVYPERIEAFPLTQFRPSSRPKRVRQGVARISHEEFAMRHDHLAAPVALLALLAGIGPLAAQAPAVPPAAQGRIEEAARALEKDPKFKRLPPERRQELVKFVVGNTLFALVHEFGHTAISEMGLPVLGREEDAADSFAAVIGLVMGTEM